MSDLSASMSTAGTAAPPPHKRHGVSFEDFAAGRISGRRCRPTVMQMDSMRSSHRGAFTKLRPV